MCIATVVLVNHIFCVEISVTVLPGGLNKLNKFFGFQVYLALVPKGQMNELKKLCME